MKFTNLSTETPKWQETPDGFLRCKARILAERVMNYHRSEFNNELPSEFGDDIPLFVSKGEMEKSFKSLEGAPIVVGEHNWLTPEVISQFGVGSVAGSPYMDGDYLTCDLLITHPDAIEKVKSKELSEISGGYHGDLFVNAGQYNGTPYSAEQRNLCFNHIAILPAGHGRAGRDVRILNQKKEEVKMTVRVQLKNSKKFINVDEEVAAAITEDQDSQVTEETAKQKSFEDTMSSYEEKNAGMAALTSELEELKGELSVYKQKLDELLSEEAVEHKAMDMMAEGTEAAEVVDGAALPEEMNKEEIKNSLKGLWGEKLHAKVLNAIGVKTEGMSPEAIRGAFKAQHQITNSMKGKTNVAGTKFINGFNPGVVDAPAGQQAQQRTAHQRLGFK